MARPGLQPLISTACKERLHFLTWLIFRRGAKGASTKKGLAFRGAGRLKNGMMVYGRPVMAAGALTWSHIMVIPT